jgi:hypothetical protein
LQTSEARALSSADRELSTEVREIRGKTASEKSKVRTKAIDI